MILRDEILAFLAARKDTFFADFQLVKLGLFGSFARSEQTDASDIDLIVEFAPDTPGLSAKKKKLKSILQAQFNREVDLCREKYIKPYYKDQILKSAIYV